MIVSDSRKLRAVAVNHLLLVNISFVLVAASEAMFVALLVSDSPEEVVVDSAFAHPSSILCLSMSFLEGSSVNEPLFEFSFNGSMLEDSMIPGRASTTPACWFFTASLSG